MTVSRQASLPHDLDLVVDFVNTRDIDRDTDRDTDELATPARLAAWLQERGLLPEGVGLGAAELDQAIELREALREALLAHNGTRGSGGTAPLERVAEQGRLSVRFGEDGTVRVEARAGGFPGALAQLLVPVAQAASDGTWERVKACAADDCRWAFYDRSRNRAGRWCDMAVCGNRTKVRAYRSKRRA
jgi:predicted RNA-binding Zn ribbon-like protein